MVYAYSPIFWKLLTIMHFYFSTVHKFMSIFAYKHEIKKILCTEVCLEHHFLVTSLTKH